MTKLQYIVKLLFGKKRFVLIVLAHKSAMCRSKYKCCKCNPKHNTLLHEVFVSNPTTTGSSELIVSAVVLTQTLSPTLQPCFVRNNNIGVNLINESASAQSTLLATAMVIVRDAKGKLHTVRAMIDPCSQCSIVYDALCKQLQLPTISNTLAVSGIGGNSKLSAIGSPCK